MSVYTHQPRVTATKLGTRQQANSEHATCQRCGINFATRHRTRTDRTHCRDCKPYVKGTN